MNGISTSKGGTHVAMLADLVASHIAGHMNKYHSKELMGASVSLSIHWCCSASCCACFR